jgi:ATP citrate (pro-S)-lyase
MNTIVTTRAGKDLISSLASGLLTIGSRFGGALDEAAAMFSQARDTGLTPREFVDQCRKQNKLISGIGHKIKSVNNPDLRVELVKEYVRKHFPSHSLLDYALAVEQVTTAKKDTLILNVDGCIAVCFVDLLRDSGAFTSDEAEEYIRIGTLNGLFVLGRSIGFIGHHLDQKRLRAGLYRHPADDIFINMVRPLSSARFGALADAYRRRTCPSRVCSRRWRRRCLPSLPLVASCSAVSSLRSPSVQVSVSRGRVLR